MGATKLCFVVQRPPYKSENPRLALTHSISSQTAEIRWERMWEKVRSSAGVAA